VLGVQEHQSQSGIKKEKLLRVISHQKNRGAAID
jgi:hypothetical protein